MSSIRRAGVAASIFLLAVGFARAADMGTEAKRMIKEKAKGTYYLKTNVPYFQGRHAYGTFKRSLVIVTPEEGPKIQSSAEVQPSTPKDGGWSCA